MIYLAFTEEQSLAAPEAWGANCGPHAIAAGLGVTLDRARELLPKFEGRFYTTPKMMEEAMMAARGSICCLKGGPSREWRNGIIRVQWEGRWTNPGVPKIAAYPKTHWIAHFDGFVYCTCCPHEWWRVETWQRIIEAHVIGQNGVTGWHFTHCHLLPTPMEAAHG